MKSLFLCTLIGLPFTSTTPTPVVAFSVRQLIPAYTGKCMQVRRSSDNDTLSIGFTPSGHLDTTKLKAFVGADSGYVQIWYDQSGNGLDATQKNPATQPTIMVRGVINRDNGQPSVYTNGSLGYLYYMPVTQLTSQVTRMEVCRNRSGNFEIVEGLGYFQMDLQLFPDHIWVQYDDGNITVASTTVTTTKNLMSINSVRNSTASKLYVNTIFQGSTSPVNVRFFYNPADTLAVYNAAHAFKTSTGAANISNLTWFKTVGETYTPDSLTAMPKATVKGSYITFTPVYNSINGINYAEFDGVPSFSGGTGVYIVSNSYVTLPVVISSFTGRRVSETTLLAWTTQSESNTSRFDIQRSPDASGWTVIGQVPAAGNSAAPLSYQFTDTASLPGITAIYYRLKLLDKDGKSTYSGIVQVTNPTVAASALKQ